MLEATGDLWILAKGSPLCITTNGDINSRGRAVMGRGIALEAAQRFPELPRELAKLIAMYGNHVHPLFWHPISGLVNLYFLISFPVKDDWREAADPKLILRSAIELVKLADRMLLDFLKIYLPRPGCSNGHLKWEDVKPIIEPLLDDRFVVVTR